MRLSAYDPAAVSRQRRAGCSCHAPAHARAVALSTARVVAERSRARRRVKDDERDEHAEALARIGVEPIVLAGAAGSQCRPFLVVQKDQEKFAACNALADEIGPIDDPKKAFELIGELIGDEVNEVFGLITLDIHKRFKSALVTGRGEADAVMAPMVPTLQAALIDGAHSIVLMHCHPSGVPAEPSEADEETTAAFADACEIINVNLLDHVIAGMDGKKRDYFSFLDAGLLPPLEEDA